MKYLLIILILASCSSSKKNTLQLKTWHPVYGNVKRYDTTLVSPGIYKVRENCKDHYHYKYFSTDPNIWVSPKWEIENYNKK